MLTLLDAKQSSIPEIAGVPPNSAQFARQINDACRRFMRRGDWKGTVVPIYTCVRNGCVVWNRYVGQVRKVNSCRTTITVKNMWGDYLPFEAGGWDRSYWWSWMGGRCSITEQGVSPTYSGIVADGRTLRAYVQTPLDNNKKLIIFGEDCNGQPLMTQGAGPWSQGITLTLQAPYAETTQTVRRIDRIIKDPTQGQVFLYANNAGTLEDLAVYEPSETSPEFLRTQVRVPSSGSCSTDCTSPLIAIVKLRFIPVVTDNDLIIVNNIDALELMIQSIKYARAGDTQNAGAFELQAIREANMQLYDEDNENDAIPIGIDGMNKTGMGMQKCF